jgi:co-chaperonin GroES (HSP10)
MTIEIDVTRLDRVFGDRVLIKRRGEPTKKRGLFVPASVAMKKEPKKIWWGELVQFGTESGAAALHGLSVGDTVGVEPIGNHYASWKAADGFEYCWVPDEHLALADNGSVEDYYADKLDRASHPQLRVLGRRVLARPVAEDEAVRGIYRTHENEADAKLADVLLVGPAPADGDPVPVDVGARVLHVVADAGSSAAVDIFEPALLVLRVEDLIGEYTKTEAPKEEPAHV